MKNVLICNRSEIALRAALACKSLGLKSFVLINDFEVDTLVGESCDKLIKFNDSINPFMSLEIIEKVIKQYEINFLYPGYGFLSEDPRLAALCERLGVVFIGPRSSVLTQLSSKKESFLFAKSCGLKTLEVQNPVASDFPLMLKASYGGGGRGNLICSDLDYFKEDLKKIKIKSKGLFDNDEILFERFLPNARHVELQIVATAKKVYFLSTRDCSIQINYQKFMEEGPSDQSSCEFIKRFYPQIEKELLNIGYTGVGTIEFLWSGSDLYFLEMNTRIQVEHPVTELIFDIDLVKIQFEIALNQLIKYSFVNNGKHAICARLYAVDVENDFAPMPSTIRLAGSDKYIRFDTHFKDGNHIGHQYDPLIGKLIVSGENRRDCIANFKDALAKIKIGTRQNNLNLISYIISDKEYLDNDVSVSWVKNSIANSFSNSLNDFSVEEKKAIWSKIRGEKSHKLMAVGGEVNIDILVDWIDEVIYCFKKKKAYSSCLGLNPPFWKEESEQSVLNYISPITGKVTQILCSTGDQVEKGDTLLVLEAMKTELRVKAHSNGIVGEILCEEGGLVKRGQELLVI